MTENKAIQIIKREEQWESNASISNAFNTAIKALEENQQYHAIGTVEECQSAVEKQRAKRPSDYQIDDEYDSGYCPCCGKTVYDDGGGYCPYCGQMLEWDEEE